MKRVIEFDGSRQDQERFVLLHLGYVTGGNTLNAGQDGVKAPVKKSIDVLRREARITRLLEGISEEATDVAENHRGLRNLKAGAHTLTLDQPDYDLLKRYIDEGFAPYTFVQRAEAIVDLVDWLSAAATVDPAKQLAAATVDPAKQLAAAPGEPAA